MAHSSSSPSDTQLATPPRMDTFTPDQERLLLDVARTAISRRLVSHEQLDVDPEDFPEPLRARRAVFVTLRRDGHLRGCIGTLEPIHTLIEDTARNAMASAFDDPRFPPLGKAELPGLEIQLSVLTEPEAMNFRDEEDLLDQLEAGRDGLILERRGRRGTFLPAVWVTIPDKREFLNHLKQKAGLPPLPLRRDVSAKRYRAITVK